MSEQAPRSNSRLENFDTNKAAKEREEFEGAVYGEAGTTDFSDEARKRVEEADAYERHMEKLAEEKRLDYDRGLDRLESGEAESAAYNREWDDATAENEAFDAARKAEAEVFEEKFAKNPSLRQMDRISKEIHELRSKEVTPDTVDQDTRRLGELDDRLQELLEKYSGSDDYDPAIADFLMDHDDKSGLDRGAKDLLEKREVKASRTPEDFKASDSRGSDYVDKDTALNEAYDEYETREGSPYDVDKGREKDTEKAHEDAITEYGTAERGGEAYDVDKDRVKDIDEAHDQALEENAERSGTRVEDISEAWDQAHAEDAERTREGKWYRRAWSRMNSLFMRGMQGTGEYIGSKSKTNVALGAIAVVGVSIVVWKFGHDFSHNLVASPLDSATATVGGGHGIGTAVAEAAKSAVDHMSSLPDYTGGSPWDWAKGVFGEGNAMSQLHELASRAAADGHNVQWHGSGVHEWVSIDGSSGPKRVVDVLSGYGSK